MLNLHLGGKIVPVPRSGSHAGVFHPLSPVTLAGGDLALRFAGATVNSYHDLQIGPDDLAPELVPFALAPDRTVEGFYHPRLPLLGVMWHPERAGPRCVQLDTLLSGILRGRAPWTAAPAPAPR
jgi:putative glutamine amidotransferase